MLKTFLAELFQCWKLSKEVTLQLQVRARVVTRAKCAYICIYKMRHMFTNTLSKLLQLGILKNAFYRQK